MSPTRRPPKPSEPEEIEAAAKVLDPGAPSSPPIITGAALGPVTTPVIRGGIQGISGKLVTDGLVLFFGWPPLAEQREWLIVVFGIAISFGQNYVERRVGRKLIGATPPTMI